MDLLINAFGDIAKHYAQKYINTDDNALNVKVIGMVSIIITLLTKIIINFVSSDLYSRIMRYITYNIFKRRTWAFPLFYESFQCPGAYNIKPNNYKRITLIYEDVNVFYKLIKKLVYNNLHYNDVYMGYRNITREVNAENVVIDKIWLKERLSKCELSINNEYYKIAYIDGYYIYIRFNGSAELNFESESFVVLNKFMDYVEKEMKSLYEINKKNELAIYEYEFQNNKNCNIKIGVVKTGLTMENYVSRHKTMLLAKLNDFKKGELFKNNPYLDNNLGILLHGEYGTGKSYLVSAVANYLNRDIFNVNFTKIKTKTAFREIINQETCKKYVFCFDEFDYLLADVLNKNETEAKQDIHLKISTLTAQLASVKDNKELSDSLIEQLKKLMEDGTSENLSYSFILSELSGITSVTGRIIIATTNFIDRIPPALKRPGRFDYVLKLGHFNNDEIRELLVKLYTPSAKDKAKLAKTIFPANKYTPSEIILRACEHPELSDMVNYLTCK